MSSKICRMGERSYGWKFWVLAHLVTAAEWQKSQYDVPATIRSFSVGDWVLRLYPPNTNRDKLNSYTGPFLVIKVMGEIIYLFIIKNSYVTFYSPCGWWCPCQRVASYASSWGWWPPLSVVEGKEMPTPSNCDITVSDLEDDKSATRSHPQTEGDESEIVGIPDRPSLNTRNPKPPTSFEWED